MGSTQSMSMRDMINLDRTLRWHLTYNHVPSLPLDMLPVAKEALQLLNQGKYHTKVKCPFEHKRYGFNVPASAVADALHLWDLVDADDEWYE